MGDENKECAMKIIVKDRGPRVVIVIVKGQSRLFILLEINYLA